MKLRKTTNISEKIFTKVLTNRIIYGIISYKVKEDNTQTQKIFTITVDKVYYT